MKFNTKTSLRALGAFATAATMLMPSAMLAGEVQLTSSDGTVNMRGELIAFEDNAYILGTALGQLRVSASRVSCTGADCPQLDVASADVRIAGSDTIGLGLMPLLLEGYSGDLGAEATLGNATASGEVIANFVSDQGFGEDLASFLVSPTTSGDGFDALQNKTAQIGMSSRRIVPQEARSLRDAGAGNMIDPRQENIIAVDSLVVVVNPDNPVSQLTTQQLKDIYTGKIKNWSQVGGEDEAIEVVTYREGSGTRSVFERRLFGDEAFELSSDAAVADSNAVASETIQQSQNAIAFVGYAFQRGARPLTLVNECGISMVPDAFSARTEEYALQRRLYLYSRADNTDEVTRGFLDFATSDKADGLIGKAGFIGFGIDRRAQSGDTPRAQSLSQLSATDGYESGFMRQMLNTMGDFDRLSTTFRFRTGSSQLDERGRIDMGRLVNYLSAQPAGTEALVVGFTDSVGQFDGNLQLSQSRAAQIAQELKAAGGNDIGNVTISSVGYGEIAPSGCNINDEGRRINRRVEVWIKNPA